MCLTELLLDCLTNKILDLVLAPSPRLEARLAPADNAPSVMRLLFNEEEIGYQVQEIY